MSCSLFYRANGESSVMTASTDSTALIAGCGYVGLRAARLWTRRGIRTNAITRSNEKAALLRADGIHPIVADFSSGNELLNLPDADVVLWSVGFDRSPDATRQAAWIDGLRTLLASLPMRAASRRVLYTSSTSVYGDGGVVDEDTVPNPTSESAQACFVAENILSDFAARTGTTVSILRLAGIYGPDRLLRRICDLRAGVPLTAEPDEWLNLVHVDDVVSVIDAVSRCENPPRLMNVVAAGSVTRRTYYTTLARLVNAPAPTFENADPLSLSERRRGGNRRVTSRIRSELPVTFQFDDCESGLRHAIEKSGGL